MKIRKFNESNQSVVENIKECFIDLVELSSLDDGLTVDECFFIYDEKSEFWISISLPGIKIYNDSDIIEQMLRLNKSISSRYESILDCIERVKLTYGDIEYRYEINNTETEKINKNVHIPYIECIEIVFKI